MGFGWVETGAGVARCVTHPAAPPGRELLNAAKKLPAEFRVQALMLTVAPANVTAMRLFVSEGFRGTMLEFRYDVE